MSRLGTYLQDELHRRDLSPEEFGRRSGLGTSHVYQIIRGQKPNVRQATIARIADGLNMSAGELLMAVDDEVADDPIEQAIRQRTAEMREAVQGTPQRMWATIIRKTFDHAIVVARDLAEMVGSEVNADPAPADNGQPEPTNDGKPRRRPELRARELVPA